MMRKPVMSPILDKARRCVAKGNLEECLELLLGAFSDLQLKESSRWRVRNDIINFKARFSRIRAEKPNIQFEQHEMLLNRLTTDVLDFLLTIDAEIAENAQNAPAKHSKNTYRVELMLDMDFQNTSDEEIQALLNKISNIIKSRPDELTIINKRPGSIILELEISAETIIRIKSLVAFEIIQELKDVKAMDNDWDWMNADEKFYVYLPHANLGEREVGSSQIDENLMDDNPTDYVENLKDKEEEEFEAMMVAMEPEVCEEPIEEYHPAETFSVLDEVSAEPETMNDTEEAIESAFLKAVEEREEYRKLIPDLDLNERNLDWADLNWANLSGLDLQNVSLRGANLRGAGLRGANLIQSDLTEAILSSADMRSAELFNAKLQRANLRWADLRDASLIFTYLVEADLNGVDMTGAFTSYANFRGANLSWAKLIDVRLNETKLTGAKLTGATIHINQAAILKALNVDVSEVIFVDDDGEK